MSILDNNMWDVWGMEAACVLCQHESSIDQIKKLCSGFSLWWEWNVTREKNNNTYPPPPFSFTSITYYLCHCHNMCTCLVASFLPKDLGVAKESFSFLYVFFPSNILKCFQVISLKRLNHFDEMFCFFKNYTLTPTHTLKIPAPSQTHTLLHTFNTYIFYPNFFCCCCYALNACFTLSLSNHIMY